MDISYLKTLIEVAQTGSFSKAARNLYLTQSAVSRRIKLLEDQYDCLLLDRSTPQLHPTDIGRQVIEKARLLIKIEEDLWRTVKKEQVPSISFSCTPAFGNTYLPSVLKKFSPCTSRTEDLRVTFGSATTIPQEIRSGKFDLAVVEHCPNLDLTGLQTYSLPDDEMVFISTAALGLKNESLPFEALTGCCLYRRGDDSCSHMLLETNLQKIGKSLQDFSYSIIYDDLHLILKAVELGSGIAFVSRSVAEELITQGKVHAHRIEGFSHHRLRTLLVPTIDPPPLAHQQFISCIASTFGIALPS